MFIFIFYFIIFGFFPALSYNFQISREVEAAIKDEDHPVLFEDINRQQEQIRQVFDTLRKAFSLRDAITPYQSPVNDGTIISETPWSSEGKKIRRRRSDYWSTFDILYKSLQLFISSGPENSTSAQNPPLAFGKKLASNSTKTLESLGDKSGLRLRRKRFILPALAIWKIIEAIQGAIKEPKDILSSFPTPPGPLKSADSEFGSTHRRKRSVFLPVLALWSVLKATKTENSNQQFRKVAPRTTVAPITSTTPKPTVIFTKAPVVKSIVKSAGTEPEIFVEFFSMPASPKMPGAFYPQKENSEDIPFDYDILSAKTIKKNP